jgi:CBS-domain-containing membrane protein
MHRKPFIRALERALAGGAAIALMVAIADATGYPLMGLPFTTSIVMVLGSPEVPAARPVTVFFGHLIRAATAVGYTSLFGFEPWVAAVAITLSMLLMQSFDVFHPPAGITPVIVTSSHAGSSFILFPVLAGVILLIAFSAICKRLSEPQPKSKAP